MLIQKQSLNLCCCSPCTPQPSATQCFKQSGAPVQNNHTCQKKGTSTFAEALPSWLYKQLATVQILESTACVNLLWKQDQHLRDVSLFKIWTCSFSLEDLQHTQGCNVKFWSYLLFLSETELGKPHCSLSSTTNCNTNTHIYRYVIWKHCVIQISGMSCFQDNQMGCMLFTLKSCPWRQLRNEPFMKHSHSCCCKSVS